MRPYSTMPGSPASTRRSASPDTALGVGDVIQNPALAALLVTCCAALVAGTSLLAKALGTDALGHPMNAVQISFGRFLFAFIALGMVAALVRPRLHRPHLPLHLGRTGFGFLGITLMFGAAARIPLSDATAISFLNPVFGMLLAIPFLGEKIGRWRWIGTGIALVGAAVLLRPGAESFEPAALLALGAALAMGAELIFIKRLTRRERPFQILLTNNALGVCIAGLAVLPVWIMPSPAQWLAMAAIGGLMALAQTCFVHATARADASFVAPFFYATLVFAAFYDMVIFGVLPDAVSLLGALVIVTGALLLAYHEGRRSRMPPLTASRSAPATHRSPPPR
ncbi:MAG: DMT family transporter [Celeribacter sp.]|jgi:drug/metabolite transporter (DMT)-like permease